MHSSVAATVCALLWWKCGWLALVAAANESTTIAFTLGSGLAPPDKWPDVNSAIPRCPESGANLFWPVFLTLFAVLVVALFGYAFWKYYWSIRHGKHLVLVTDVEKADPEYAFDNPGFREGTPVIRAKKQTTDTKENSFRDDSNGISKSNNDDHPNQTSENTGFTNWMSGTIVPLKGRDFAGLGFGLCGTKRDGIFVKDLLHHGPAFESGRIKTGDRITAVRINFGEVELKDAEDILRSASPYEIEIEIEDSRRGVKRSFFRDQSQPTVRSQVTALAYANGTATKNEAALSKPAVLEVVSEMSDKMSKYGVRVLPDIGDSKMSNVIAISQPVTTSEKQLAATPATAKVISRPPVAAASSTVVVVDSQTTCFDEVDLPLPRSNLVGDSNYCRTADTSTATITDKAFPASNLVSSLKDANMKKALVMGYQNLKEKITQRVHKSNSTASPLPHEVDSSSGNGALRWNKVAADDGDGDRGDALRTKRIDLRLRSGSISSTEGDDDPLAPKAAKRKAPRPPPSETFVGDTNYGSSGPGPMVVASSDFNLLDEIDDEVKKNIVEEDNDSVMKEAERHRNACTIELNASHVTVHHGADDGGRKAASLGDLSKIEDDGSHVAPPLERAVSLELAEHTPRASKKRKAPYPPEEAATVNVADIVLVDGTNVRRDSVHVEVGVCKLKKSSLFGALEPPLALVTSAVDAGVVPVAAPKLKKSSLFGTMEEAVRTVADSSDGGNMLASGSHYAVLSSTPLKVPNVHTNDRLYLPGQRGEHSANIGDCDSDGSDVEVVPALPTSPVPTLPSPMAANTFATEIDVEVGAEAPSSSAASIAVATPAYPSSDSEDAEDATALFTTAAELNLSRASDDELTDGVNGNGDANGIDGANVSIVDDESRDEYSSMNTIKEMNQDEVEAPLASHSAASSSNSSLSALPLTPISSKVTSAGPSLSTIVSAPPITAAVMSTATSSTTSAPVGTTVVASAVAKLQNGSPTFVKPDTRATSLLKFESPVSSAIARFEVPAASTIHAEEPSNVKSNKSRRNSSSSSSSGSISCTVNSVNGSARTSPRRFSNGSSIGGLEVRIKSPNAAVKSPKFSQSVSPVRAVGSRIPVRANTEPSLKVSLIHKDDSPAKLRKYDVNMENGKINFVSSNHIANPSHKTSVLPETRHNGR